jgi:hypothetical protein
MTFREIRIITGFSESTIAKISSGNTEGFDQATITLIKFYLQFENNYLKLLFAKPEFACICEDVIEKSTKRDHKSIVKIIRFANKCLRRHRTLLNGECTIHSEVDIKNLFESYFKDCEALIRDEYFIPMCEIGMLKDPGIRPYADHLIDIAEMLQNVSNGQSQN